MKQTTITPMCGQCKSYDLDRQYCSKFVITEHYPDGTKLTTYAPRAADANVCDRYVQDIPF